MHDVMPHPISLVFYTGMTLVVRLSVDLLRVSFDVQTAMA
jgi:hypothetical protein